LIAKLSHLLATRDSFIKYTKLEALRVVVVVIITQEFSPNFIYAVIALFNKNNINNAHQTSQKN
jgi:hypothetical protein